MENEHTEQKYPRLNIFNSLKGKLILFFLAVSLIPLLLAVWLTYFRARQELRVEAFKKLETVRDAKFEEIDTFFDGIERDLRLLSELDMVSEAYRSLSSTMSMVGPAKVRTLGFMGNPTREGADTLNPYSLTHIKYYDFFSNIVQARGYQDVLLVSPYTGDIVYSYAKQDDFATSLLNGPYQSTALADLFRKLKDEAESGDVFMTDFVNYPPAGDTPVNFVGIRLIDRVHGTKGILIYELPIGLIDNLMRKGQDVHPGGAETYLVGETKRILSTTDFSDEIFDLPAVEKGQLTSGITEDAQRSMLSAYRPIEKGGVKWVLLAEQPEEEAIKTAKELSVWMLGILLGTTGLVILVGLFVAFRIARPIEYLTDVARQVTGGNLEVRVPVKSQDETGQLAQAFNSMTSQLRQLIGLLEEQVQERTTELAVSIEVGQRATAIRDVNKLLPTIAEFVRDKFNLHHVQIFLVDDIDQNLVLRAGTGQAGQELLARHLSLPIDSKSTVGQAAVQSQPVIITDTSIGNIDINWSVPASWYSMLLKEAQAQRPASLLPETLSELTIPLIVEGQVIGVLDLQDDKIRTFTKDNLNVYEAIAVQLAIAIDSARQWALTQEAQARAEEAVRQLTRQAWAERLASARGRVGFVYDLSKIAALLPDAYSLTSTPKNGLSVPLVVQEQTIGYLSVATPPDRDWTEDERILLQAVAQQLAQKVENLRLFEATQQRASREQIARRIIDRVRASRNIETALKTATEELSRALGAARATADLQIVSQAQSIPAEEQDSDSAEINAPNLSSANSSLDEASPPFDFEQKVSQANAHYQEQK
ncbi:MAG: GAF domain-containing protein [Anaerolineae bacterium]|nr:GAF domain-containing protein [Anaerolineae bacterium]